MQVHVGILAIGDEVVDGQIINKNAAWLAIAINKVGAKVQYHLSCRDQKKDIIESLEYLKQHCNLVLVSGGLGPTTDDCTRQSLSEFLKQPLEFQKNLWTDIEKKLLNRKVTVRDSHRNQAYIPKDALFLDNPRGIAPGFFAESESFYLASLPGPPSELQSMFEQSLLPLIKQHLKPASDRKLYTWICMGAPESEIAYIAENLLIGSKNLQIGFRLHKPFVELKIWGPQKLSAQHEKIFRLLDEKLKPWVIAPSIEILRKKFHAVLTQFENIFVIDHLTYGLLLDKIKSGPKVDHLRYQCFDHGSKKTFSLQEIKQIQKVLMTDKDQLFLGIFPHGEASSCIFINEHIETITSDRKFPIRSQIGQLFAIETLFLKTISLHGRTHG